MNLMALSQKYAREILGSRRKTAIFLVAILFVAIAAWKVLGSSKPRSQYQTAQAERGTLVTSVSASGNITAGGSVSLTTSATGIVNNVYVKAGETVTQGQKIADIILDRDSAQKQAAAWSSYLSARNTLGSAKANLYTLQNQLFVANQKFVNDAAARGLSTGDPTYIEENATWLAAEAQYKNQAGVISQAQASVSSAWLAYQLTSSTITAPAEGVVASLSIAPGVPITSQTTSSSASSQSSQQVGSITLTKGHVQTVVSLSEIDGAKVKPGQKATLTLDALPGKTFTGTVVVVDTAGAVSSGVTTYPTTIQLDTAEGNIYKNMSVTAKIITNVRDGVILVPSAAVQTTGGQSTVRELKNGQMITVPVEIGDANDTQTEVTSGVNEGDTVVTSLVTTTSGRNTTSPFGGGFGGGAGRFLGR